MPLITLGERLTQDLGLLSKLPSREYVSEFCKQALEALGVGSKKATLKNAADALSMDLDSVSGAIMALSFLFIEAAKRNLSSSELVQSLGDVGITEDSKREVGEYYGSHTTELREGLGVLGLEKGGGSGGSALASLSLTVGKEERRGGAGALLTASGASATLPEYRGLEWRLEVEVAKRSLLEALHPHFEVQLGVSGLGLEGGGGKGGSSGSGSGSGSGSLTSAGPHVCTFQADYDVLKRAAATLQSAELERSTAHVKRVYKFL